MKLRTRNLVIAGLFLFFGFGGWFLDREEASRASLADGVDPMEAASMEEGFGYDPDTPASAIDKERLQRLAAKSCECERSGMSEENCWSDYRRQVAQYQTSMAARACGPISTTMDCISTDQGERCIVTGYGVSGICTPGEASAVEAVYSETYRNEMTERGFPPEPNWTEMDDNASKRWSAAADRANEAANAAIDSLVERIRAGERFVSKGRGGGCAG